MAVKTAISHCLVLRWHPRVPAVTGSCPARYLARRGGTRLLTVQVSAWLSSVLRIVVRYANNPRYVPEGLFRQRIPMRPVGEGTTGFTALELGGDDMGPERAGGKPLPGRPISRRSVLAGVGAGAVVAGAGGVLSACSSGIKGANSGGSTKNITIGWIHPLTGPLAGFGAPDNWVISKIKQTAPYKNGFKAGGKTYSVTIKSYDSQSSPTRAGDLARTAILNDGVDLLLASSTPETVNTVASQAESLHTPLICSNGQWEPWYQPRGKPGEPDAQAQVRGDVLP